MSPRCRCLGGPGSFPSLAQCVSCLSYFLLSLFSSITLLFHFAVLLPLCFHLRCPFVVVCVSLVGDLAAVLDTRMLLTLSPGGDTLQSLLDALSLPPGSRLSASIALVFVGGALVLLLSLVVFLLSAYLPFVWCIRLCHLL